MRLVPSGIAGEYHPKTQVIRVKSIEDIDALAHELGHYLQDVYGNLTRQVTQNLLEWEQNCMRIADK